MTTITVEMVADIDNIDVYKVRGNEHYFKCPICGKKALKCSYNPTKGKEYNGVTTGLWSCFICGGGDAIDLHAKIHGWSYREALDDLLGNQHIADRPITRKEAPVIKTIEAKRADAKTVDRTYRDLLKISSLSEKHKADLLRRGFTEKMIDLFGFKDAPTNGMKTARELVAMGDNPIGTPGFYNNSFALTIAGIKESGYFCPAYYPKQVSREELLKEFIAANGNLLCVKTNDGRYFVYDITGFQKRVDFPKDGNKYKWLSSSERRDGVSSGSPSTCLIGTTPHVVIITEGILKATVTYSLLGGKYTVVGVPGVKSLGGLRRLIAEGFITKDDLIFEAFDMDKAPLTNEAFLTAFNNRKEKYRNMGLDAYRTHVEKKQRSIKADADNLCEVVTNTIGAKIIPVKWDDTADKKWYGNFKGIDDMLLNDGAVEGFHKYIAEKQKLYAESKQVAEKTVTMAVAATN